MLPTFRRFRRLVATAAANSISGLPDKWHHMMELGQEFGRHVWWQRTAPYRTYSAPLIDRLNTCSTAHPPAFEDVCCPNPLPEFQKLEVFCSEQVEIGLTEGKLSLTTEQRNKVLELWNVVEDHDKHPEQFNQLYRTHWGNTLYCHSKRDDLLDAAVIQRVKMAKHYAPAHIMPGSQATPGTAGPASSVPSTLPMTATQTVSWARATQYKRKVKEHPSAVGS